jgi:hypothetical protein
MGSLVRNVILLVIAIILIACMPIAVIWSINVLFPIANIPLTFTTWLAALILFGSISYSRSK